MAQHDYSIANQSGAAFRSDLNNALSAIVTQNSGATAPSTTYAYQSWADTTTGVMKMRNGANSAWITLYQLDGEWSTIAFENGTAAAPSIYFKDSGTDTGFYSPGTDQVGIATAGASRLVVDATGQVGIGTTPSALLDLGTSTPIVRLSDANTTGYHQIRTSNANFIIDADPSNETPSSLLSFYVDGTERARITDDNYLRLASGSLGIQFNGDTAAANALDDYEEGTWTPVVADAATAGNTATGTFTGFYTKIGNLVTATASLTDITTTGMTGTNNLFIRSLPFTAASYAGTNYFTGGVAAANTTVAPFSASILDNTSYIRLVLNQSTNQAIYFCKVNEFTSGSADVFCTITYQTA